MFIRSRRFIAALLICLCVTLYFCIPTTSNIYRSRDNFSVDTVVAALKKDDTAWLLKYFPYWNHKIYVVDDPQASLTVPKNKGREAMAYLTCGFLI